MTRGKVCGLTREADLAAAVEAGADAVGVVSEVPVETPREVSRERAADLLEAVPPLVTGVLVTMPETVEEAIDLVADVDPDALQVHGGLEPADLEFLTNQVDADVIFAVDADDVGALEAYDGVADALLVDSVDEDGGGGTGETHDWERTREETADLDAPVILAGGLEPENVAEAIRTVEPFAVDVASGVEAEGGLKDHDAVRTFIERARTAIRRVEGKP
ncbi:phosphoribosylanthranilate isomerase [Natrialbaceae archaeon A-gly3]